MEGFINDKKIIFAMVGLPARGKVVQNSFLILTTSLDLHFSKDCMLFELAWFQS